MFARRFTNAIPQKTSFFVAALTTVLLLPSLPTNSLANENLLTKTHSKIQAQNSKNPATISLSHQLGEPFVVYIWDRSCYSCIQDLQQFDQMNQANTSKGFSLLLDQQQSLTPLSADILSIPQSLGSTTHLYNPYLRAQDINSTHLPEVRVYNQFGGLAARYPNFIRDWPEVQALLEQLKTPAFAQYAMTNPGESPHLNSATKGQGNLFNQQRIIQQERNHNWQEHPLRQPKPLTSPRIFGANTRIDTIEPHLIALSKPMAFFALHLNTGLDVGTNWQGLAARIVKKLDLDQRLYFDAQWNNGSDTGDQPLAPEAQTPKAQTITLGYQSYWDEVQYDASIFFRSRTYRDDTGLFISASHLLWNDRTKIRLGLGVFNSTHEASTTIQQAADDESRLHQVTLSHSIDPQTRFTFSWHNDGLQGILENPNALVLFGVPGALGTQYALYPTTRTQNNYIIRWIKNEHSSGYSFYEDTWGIEQHQLFLIRQSQYKQWHIEQEARLTHQVNAKFFSNLYPGQNAQSLLSRSPELAGYDSLKLTLHGEKKLLRQFWNKPTYFTLKAGLEYIDFEALSTIDDSAQSPATMLVLSTSVGLRLDLE